ncbi:F0F1 ATP synthase subunit B [Streptococcaceae bacterium ESL0687]|nr:F0F1 ATP synthase subunit B [Streptococcaceae bacterium ESL0687]
MFIMLEATEKSTMLGDIFVATGAVLILMVLIKKFAWGAITNIFEQRAKKISDDIDGAEAARAKAEELAKRREAELSTSRKEASQILKDATATANTSSDKIITEAREEAIILKKRAAEEISREHDEALLNVKGEIADISVRLAEKLIGNSLDEKSQSGLIDAYLEKLGNE